MPSNLPSNIAHLGRTIRNIRRAREIIGVLVSFGFGEAVRDLELDRLVQRGRRMVGLGAKEAVSSDVQRKPTAVRLREAMEELGPTFVKLAQVLSTRPDLIPPEWAEEFTKLQSTVRPVPAEEIKPYIDELIERMPATSQEGPRFHRIEYESMAAGSIAQAHRATLAGGGGEVVLKVLRPGIEAVIEADLEIMATLAEFIEDRFTDLGYSPVEVVEQFRRQVRREIDLELERRSMARMAAAFAEDDRVRFPRVYPQHSTPEILCMERIDGVLLSDFKKHPEDHFTEAQRREIVAIGSDVVFRQCFETGFFHADPHPGNIFVLIDPTVDARGEGKASELAMRQAPEVRLCFIDYGMTGNIDPRTAEVLADLVQGTIAGDLDRVLDVVIELTGVSPMKAHDRVFRADAWEFISRFQSASLADLRMGALLSEFFAKLRKHKLRVPADIVYLIKAVTTIEGVGEMVCPSFDLVSHVRPHIEGLLRRRYGFRATKRRVQGAALGYAELVERTPREVASILHMVRNEELGVQLKHHGLSEVTDEIERASRNIGYSLIVAALVVGGSIMLLADRAAASRGATDAPEGLLFWIGLAAFVFAGLLGVIRLLFGKRLS
ncbi:MAG: ABC1 kinase family protein [Phycisphaerales bacterium JB060]